MHSLHHFRYIIVHVHVFMYSPQLCCGDLKGTLEGEADMEYCISSQEEKKQLQACGREQQFEK